MWTKLNESRSVSDLIIILSCEHVTFNYGALFMYYSKRHLWSTVREESVMLVCSRVRGHGSNIRASYTSHTDAEDALFSGPIRPDRRVSPEDADKHRKEFSRSKTAMTSIFTEKQLQYWRTWWTLKEKEKSEALTRASSSDVHRAQTFITCRTHSKVALSWAQTTLFHLPVLSCLDRCSPAWTASVSLVVL